VLGSFVPGPVGVEASGVDAEGAGSPGPELSGAAELGVGAEGTSGPTGRLELEVGAGGCCASGEVVAGGALGASPLGAAFGSPVTGCVVGLEAPVGAGFAPGAWALGPAVVCAGSPGVGDVTALSDPSDESSVEPHAATADALAKTKAQ
jgi:hypothetical protein